MRFYIATLALAASSVGCERAPKQPSPTASAAPSAAAAHSARPTPAPALPAPVAVGIPLDPKKISAVVNPTNLPAFSGPTGSVRGLVTASGDRPAKKTLARVSPDCERADEMYRSTFREGMMRSLADALVTVTGYVGYVPAREEAVSVAASGCAWDRRTIALTLGQRLEAVSKDARTYAPQLLGSKSPAILMALPGGEPIKLFPTEARPYRLIDAGRDFMAADVLVLKYPTHAVTRLDGRYEITGIPPGEVTVTAFLPATMRVVEKKATVTAGGSVEVDFQVPFDEKALKAAQSPTQRAAGKAPASKP